MLLPDVVVGSVTLTSRSRPTSRPSTTNFSRLLLKFHQHYIMPMKDDDHVDASRFRLKGSEVAAAGCSAARSTLLLAEG